MYWIKRYTIHSISRLQKETIVREREHEMAERSADFRAELLLRLLVVDAAATAGAVCDISLVYRRVLAPPEADEGPALEEAKAGPAEAMAAAAAVLTLQPQLPHRTTRAVETDGHHSVRRRHVDRAKTISRPANRENLQFNEKCTFVFR